jgi:crotonobetainyl-CoA:carnitine CoA-transferase CaiB-like acyl-CoA transferase
MMLADLGADVVKVEDPSLGDYARRREPHVAGVGGMFQVLNRNKKSFTINLKHPEGVEIFNKLAKGADVILEGFRPGVMDRLGIGYEQIRQINPRIIYCSLTGYGQDGPYKDLVGHDINYLGYGGVLDISGLKDGPPISAGVQIADIGGGGMMAIIGILTAVIAREKTGKGQFIDISMLDGAISWMANHFGEYFASGKVPKRGEGRLGGGLACYSVYKTKEGKYISIGALEEKFWANLCRILGKEEFIAEQFNYGTKQEEIKAELSKIFLSKERDEWVRILSEVDICVGPVYTLDEVLNDSQASHRHMVVEIEHPSAGKIKQINNPLKLSETPPEIETPAPLLGEHTEQMLKGLGYSQEEIHRLRSQKVI